MLYNKTLLGQTGLSGVTGASSGIMHSQGIGSGNTHAISSTLKGASAVSGGRILQNNTNIQQGISKNSGIFKSVTQKNNSVHMSQKQKTEGDSIHKKNDSFGSLQVLEISTLEKNYLKRVTDKTIHLRQFGYNFFLGKPRVSLSIPVDKNYIIGPGDELFIYVIGTPAGMDTSGINKLIVDREGKIYIPGLGLFYVWGKTLGEAEKLIADALKTNIKLTVGKLRTFPVYVSGEVRQPGAVIATGVSTVIDAIIMAGGIKPTGTLRDVTVSRKSSKGIKKFHIDFYKLLLKGEQIDFRLKDGDVIFVKTIGKTVGITGVIKRPGIYEIKENTSIKALIKLAGGLLPSSYSFKVMIQRYVNNRFVRIIQGSIIDYTFMAQSVLDGDLIEIKEILNAPNNSVSIKGYISYPGFYEYRKNMKLSELITSDFFFIDTNMGSDPNIRLFTQSYTFSITVPKPIMKLTQSAPWQYSVICQKHLT
jgi:polysaccharide export outer membrane protein